MTDPLPASPQAQPGKCPNGHEWSNQFGDDWTPEQGTPCDCRAKRWGMPLERASPQARLLALVEQWQGALDRTRDYIRTAMRPISIKEACGETAYDRAERRGLQHALNAINAEFAKVEEVADELAAALRPLDIVAEKPARDASPRYSQTEMDRATKPLHAEIERLAAALRRLPPQRADEELVPHPFHSRTPYEPGDERDIWCKDCEYHRFHQIHAPQEESVS